MRMIDADTAKQTYTADLFDTEEDFERVNDIFDYAPTVDAVVVRHGRWEYIPQTLNTLSQLRCSFCGWWSIDPSIDGAYNYCPNCGCRMDGKP